VRVLEPPAPAAITRRPIQVLLVWDDRIADGCIAQAIATGSKRKPIVRNLFERLFEA
jgi:hypothetical protein